MTDAPQDERGWEQWPGKAYPLGASYDGSSTNFAIFSEVAERVELCLFDDDGTESRVPLIEVDGFVWHGFLPEVEPGQRYGYWVHGPYDPAAGRNGTASSATLCATTGAANRRLSTSSRQD